MNKIITPDEAEDGFAGCQRMMRHKEAQVRHVVHEMMKTMATPRVSFYDIPQERWDEIFKKKDKKPDEKSDTNKPKEDQPPDGVSERS